MDKTEQQPATKDDDFEKRHAKELGVGRFAKVQAAYFFIPLLAAAAGGALGWFALAKPLAKMAPKLTKSIGIIEATGKEFKDAIAMLTSGNSIETAFSKFKLSSEALEKISQSYKDVSLTEEARFAKILGVLNSIKTAEVPESVRMISAAGTGTVGLFGGSIAIGYDQWHKNESARLAAAEINHDIANMELFRPSDPEIVAENKRLRTMVAALPNIEKTSAQVQGLVEENQQKAAIN